MRKLLNFIICGIVVSGLSAHITPVRADVKIVDSKTGREMKMISGEGEFVLKKMKEKAADKKKKTQAKKTATRTVHPDEKKAKKTIEGAVMFIRSDKISVEVTAGEQGGEDVLIPLDPDFNLKGVKKISDIQPRDWVGVVFEETYLEPKEKGGEPVILDRVGLEVAFIKKALPHASSACEGQDCEKTGGAE